VNRTGRQEKQKAYDGELLSREDPRASVESEAFDGVDFQGPSLIMHQEARNRICAPMRMSLSATGSIGKVFHAVKQRQADHQRWGEWK
jgi:hypothetical protein